MRTCAALCLAGVALWVDALLGGTLAGNPVALLVVAVCAFTAGVRTPWVLLAGPATTVLLTVADQVGDPGRFAFANDVVFYAVVVLGPALLGLTLAARHRQVVRLEERRRALEQRRRALVLTARAEESARVSAEVDRALAASLAVIVEAAHDPDRLDVVEDASRAALGRLRELLGALGEPQPEPAAHVVAPDLPTRLGVVDLLLLLAGAPLAVETGPAAVDVVLSLAQGALLVLARRRPLAGAVALLAVACVQTARFAPLPPTVGWLVVGLLLAFLVGTARRRVSAYVGLSVTMAGVGLMTVLTPPAHRDLDGLAPSLAIGLLAWCGGRLLAGRQARVAELHAIAEELARTEEAAARLAGVEQRAELARELHDVGAHALTVAVLQAGAARTWRERDPQRAAQASATLRELADGPLTALSGSLGAPTDRPLIDVARDLGRVLGLRVDLDVVGEPRAVPGSVTAAAARVVQEALTNAARHAPGSTVAVRIDYDAAALRVSVRDTGATDAVPVVTGSGRGLAGMRERVAALRGEFSAGPAGGGFEVRATLPA